MSSNPSLGLSTVVYMNQGIFHNVALSIVQRMTTIGGKMDHLDWASIVKTWSQLKDQVGFDVKEFKWILT